MPFVRDCRNSVEAVVAARSLWLALSVAYLAGVFALVAQFRRDGEAGWPSAAVAVALLACVPVFMRWSLQVRTDQPAVMFAGWGGAALLAARSHRRPWLGIASGVLFALGILCSQKAGYIGGLASILFGASLARERDSLRVWRREAFLLAAAAAAFVVTLAAYFGIVSIFFRPPRVATLEGQLDTFAYYRNVFGFRAYRAMLPTLGPQIWLGACAFVALIVSGRRVLTHRTALLTGWAVAFLGLAI